MIKFIRITTLLFILLLSVKAYPSEKHFFCGKAKEIMKKNMVEGYAYFATATENNNIVIQLYINLETGAWRIVGIDDKLDACNMLNGYDWLFNKIVFL